MLRGWSETRQRPGRPAAGTGDRAEEVDGGRVRASLGRLERARAEGIEGIPSWRRMVRGDGDRARLVPCVVAVCVGEVGWLGFRVGGPVGWPANPNSFFVVVVVLLICKLEKHV